MWIVAVSYFRCPVRVSGVSGDGLPFSTALGDTGTEP